MGQAGGEFAKRQHFGSTFFRARHFASSVGHFTDELLREIRCAVHELAEFDGWHNRDSRPADGGASAIDHLDSREGKYTGWLAGGTHKDRSIRIGRPAEMHLSFQNHDEIFCRGAFTNNNLARLIGVHFEMVGKPLECCAIIIRKQRHRGEVVGS